LILNLTTRSYSNNQRHNQLENETTMLKKQFNLKLQPVTYAVLLCLSLSTSTLIPVYSYAETTTTEQSTTPDQSTQTQQESPYSKLNWQIGPKKENLADVATLNTIKGDGFLDISNSDKFLELTGNLTSGSTNVLVAEDDSWWATFDFEPSGYVKDDEKIDADALLKELKSYDEAANAERVRLGLDKLYTDSWAVPPKYDPVSKHLEWALKVRGEDNMETINYTVRLLGRTGVMSATLVSDPENLDRNIQAFKNSIKGFQYNSGERYTEFQAGDKVAEYGLAALVVGGAAAVATKKGFWAVIAAFFAATWKFILVGVAACIGFIGKIFKRNKE
jgi:uncharacterized membrane-anchored protein